MIIAWSGLVMEIKHKGSKTERHKVRGTTVRLTNIGNIVNVHHRSQREQGASMRAMKRVRIQKALCFECYTETRRRRDPEESLRGAISVRW